MEFVVIYRPTDVRNATARFAAWSPPADYDILQHYFSPDGRGFAIVDAETPQAMVAATAPFSDVMEFDVTPVAPIEAAVAATSEALAWIDSLGA